MTRIERLLAEDARVIESVLGAVTEKQRLDALQSAIDDLTIGMSAACLETVRLRDFIRAALGAADFDLCRSLLQKALHTREGLPR